MFVPNMSDSSYWWRSYTKCWPTLSRYLLMLTCYQQKSIKTVTRRYRRVSRPGRHENWHCALFLLLKTVTYALRPSEPLPVGNWHYQHKRMRCQTREDHPMDSGHWNGLFLPLPVFRSKKRNSHPGAYPDVAVLGCYICLSSTTAGVWRVGERWQHTSHKKPITKSVGKYLTIEIQLLQYPNLNRKVVQNPKSRNLESFSQIY